MRRWLRGQRRFSRLFYFAHHPSERIDITYRTINKTTGEIKECRDPITLLQTMPRDAELGGAITFEADVPDGAIYLDEATA
jgi:hypothetical protein